MYLYTCIVGVKVQHQHCGVGRWQLKFSDKTEIRELRFTTRNKTTELKKNMQKLISTKL